MLTRASGVTKESAIAWSKGNLFYKLKASQKRILEIIQEMTGRKMVIHCSRRLGKTFLLCLLSIVVCLSKPDAQVRYAAPTQKAVRKMIMPIVKKICEDCPPHLKPKWNSQEGAYIFKNGSMLHVAGVNNGHEDDLRGTDADLAVVDEAAFVDQLEYVVDSVLVPQLINTNGILIMSSSSPRSPAHEFVNYIEKAKLDGSYASIDIHESGYEPETVEEFCKEAGGSESTTWLREYLNKLIVDKDFALCAEWDPKYIQEVPKDEYFAYYHKYDGMDMGRKDFTALVFGYYDFKRAALVVESEHKMHGPTWTTETLSKDIKDKEKELWGEFKVYKRIADNNNPHLIMDLGQLHKMYFNETTKESLEAMVNEVREMVKDGRVLVHPRCKMLIGCLSLGFWDERRKEFGHSKVYGHFDHFAALMYLIRNLDKSSNPIPPTHNATWRTWTKNVDTSGQSNNAKALGNALLPKRKKETA